jgi:Zn-finger nucleic acid-binding protein
MTERQGVEIDYCPKCRGVWLDKGELDKIIERSATQSIHPQQSPGQPYRDDDDDDYKYKQDPQQPQQRRRKRGWLGDMFDFD